MIPFLYDTHCHAYFPDYASEEDAVIRRSLEAGTWMNLVGTSLETSEQAVAAAKRYGEGVYAVVGLHPTLVSGEETVNAHGETKLLQESFDYDAFLPLAREAKVVAIGEIGLDYFHLPPNTDHEALKQLQKEALREQIRLADAVEKPIVIHVRDAHEDLLVLLDDEIRKGNAMKRGVIHCFTGTAAEANAYVARGFFISFPGIVTFPAKKSDPAAQEAYFAAVRAVPAEKILVETDAPYLAPVPHRGKRNEPAFVRYTAEKIAEIRGVPLEEMAQQTTANARSLFGV